jgi:hypothetical protein
MYILVVCRWYLICLEYNKIFYHIFLNNNSDSFKMLFVTVHSDHYWAVSIVWHCTSLSIHFELVVVFWVLWASLIYLSGHSMAHAGLLCVWSITSTLEQSLMSPPYFLVSRRFLECQQPYKSLTHNNGPPDQVWAQHQPQTKVCHPRYLWE